MDNSPSAIAKRLQAGSFIEVFDISFRMLRIEEMNDLMQAVRQADAGQL